jgi:16S rRNA (cytidine1402-2'-O)-methyltransferase
MHVALYIVSTPIGNLEDITYRAVRILGEVDLILAEDTRVSKKLLNHYNISKPMLSYHDFNKEKVTPQIIKRLKDNESIALMSDAGTPGIADPAFNLVREAILENISVYPLPGASAILSALVCSGLPTDRFVFEYFLPHKSSQRLRLFEQFKNEHRTVIFYESPHRIIKVIGEMNSVLANVTVVIGRELTKIHEEFLRGTPQELLAHFTKKPPKGEMVVLLNTRITGNYKLSENDNETVPECQEDD